jgi:hypothetical protein
MSSKTSGVEISDAEGLAVPQVPIALEPGKPMAWEALEAGRYRPRRIRGSLLGRELG